MKWMKNFRNDLETVKWEQSGNLRTKNTVYVIWRHARRNEADGSTERRERREKGEQASVTYGSVKSDICAIRFPEGEEWENRAEKNI